MAVIWIPSLVSGEVKPKSFDFFCATFYSHGPLTTIDYCYAYVSQAINIKRGLCKMSTATSCKTVETGQDCQDYVDEHPECKTFTAKFEWEACNLEPRFMEVISESSNVKIARKVNGQMQNTRIDRVGNLGPAGSLSSCEKFGPEYRTYNTCNDDGNVFFSVNVQGTRPNGKYWYECQDFTFQNLKFHPEPIITRSPTKSPVAAPSKGKGGKGSRNLNGNRRRARAL